MSEVATPSNSTDFRGYAKPPSTRAASYAESDAATPHAVASDGTQTWVTRSANFVIAVSKAKAGAVLRADCPDECMVLIPKGGAATVVAGGSTEAAGRRAPSEGDTLFILPPGPSAVTVETDGVVIQIFSHLATDLRALAGNAQLYAEDTSEVAPLTAWPEPIGGFKLRKYDLARIDLNPRAPAYAFRSTNLMVVIVRAGTRRRSEQAMSPHSHLDFEQGSVTLQGEYMHHLRYPWSTDKSAWREDEHRQVSSPSVTIIPAGVIHTSQDVGEGVSQMMDVFSPPRLDFSKIPNFVLNADDYPMPTAAGA